MVWQPWLEAMYTQRPISVSECVENGFSKHSLSFDLSFRSMARLIKYLCSSVGVLVYIWTIFNRKTQRTLFLDNTEHSVRVVESLQVVRLHLTCLDFEIFQYVDFRVIFLSFEWHIWTVEITWERVIVSTLHTFQYYVPCIDKTGVERWWTQREWDTFFRTSFKKVNINFRKGNNSSI